jgi:hypothetical protein
MDDGALGQDVMEDFYTLLGVRRDGVASVVDLIATPELPAARARAEALLREHASCDTVEVWRDGALIEQLART